MNRTKRFIVPLVVLIVALLLAFFILPNRTPKTTAKFQGAADAWKACGVEQAPISVRMIHYTKDYAMATAEELQDLELELPDAGYVYLFSVNQSFQGLYAVLTDEGGRVIRTLDYKTLNAEADAAHEVRPLDEVKLLHAANYAATLYLDTVNGAVPMGDDVRTNQWYVFSDAQIAEMLK